MFCTLMQYDEWKYIEKTQTSSNPLNPNPRKWSNTLKHYISKKPTNCLGMFGHFVWLALKGYLHYKSIPCQNVSSEAQVNNFFIS